MHNDIEISVDFNNYVTKQETGFSCWHIWELRAKLKDQGMLSTIMDKSEQKALDHEEMRTWGKLGHFCTTGIPVIGVSVSAVNPVPIGSGNPCLRLNS